MPSDRLRQLEENLEDLREQLGGKEKAMRFAPLEEKVRIKQQIRELRREICQYETEYWQILAERSMTVEITEPNPEVVVAEIVEQVGSLQRREDHPPEVLELLQQIADKVNQLATPAAARLKGVLSLLPPFVNLYYEAEFDTENFVREHFPTFRQWYEALAKK